MKRLLPLLLLTSLICAGCSNQTVVLGNITSLVVAVGLFYTTLRLGKG